MKEYTILLGTDPSTLASEVNALISRGWEPAGGVAIAEVHEDAEEGQTQWAQAMIRESGHEGAAVEDAGASQGREEGS
jgi:hypothetical protein